MGTGEHRRAGSALHDTVDFQELAEHQASFVYVGCRLLWHVPWHQSRTTACHILSRSAAQQLRKVFSGHASAPFSPFARFDSVENRHASRVAYGDGPARTPRRLVVSQERRACWGAGVIKKKCAPGQ
jgi:hypothetical protein